MEVTPLPRQLTLYVNYACHLRCLHCYLYGVAEYDRKYMSPMSRGAMTWDVFSRSVDPGLETGQPMTIFLMGGEPCLHPDIVTMVKHVSSRAGVYVDMNTHGMMLPRFAVPLIDAGINAIYVSLDGSCAETNDSLRGAGTFDRTVAGINAAVRARSGQRSVKVAINATVTKYNVGDLRALTTLAESLGVDELFLNLPTFVRESEGIAASHLMEKAHKIRFTSWRGFVIDSVIDGIDGDKLAEELEALSGTKWNMRVFLQPVGYKPKELATYFTDGWKRVVRERCCSVRNFRTTVLPNGDVTPCTIYPDIVLGNVTSQSLRDIWTGENYSRFRADVGRRLYPTCHRCCDLFDETLGDPDAFLNGSRENLKLTTAS